MVLFENEEARKLMYKTYRIPMYKKWYFGIRSLLNELHIYPFDDKSMRISAYEVGLGSGIMWENLGEQLGSKMAIRIKTFFVAIVFIAICYIILYYPMLFSLEAHSDA